MKKWIAVILTSVLLCGCTVNTASLPEQFEDKVNAVLDGETGIADYNKLYYSYYIEPSVGRLFSNPSGNVFMYAGTKFLMNLNIPSIINQKSYPNSTADGIENVDQAYLEKSGTYRNASDQEEEYHIWIIQQGSSYLTLVNSACMNFYAVSDGLTAVNLAAEMLKIARTVVINEEQILADYSNNKVLDYNTQKIELYNEITPESGNVADLIGITNTVGQGTDSYSNDGQTRIESDDEE